MCICCALVGTIKDSVSQNARCNSGVTTKELSLSAVYLYPRWGKMTDIDLQWRSLRTNVACKISNISPGWNTLYWPHQGHNYLGSQQID